MSASDRWRDALRSWAIPEAILAAAPESPYGFPTEPFRHRAARSRSAAPTPTTLRALEALPEDGTVLDVGVGGGSTSLPLAARARSITGVDASAAMLEAFAQTARGGDVHVETVEGTWPEVGAVLHHTQMLVLHDTTEVRESEPPRRLLLEARARPLVVAMVSVTLEPDRDGTRTILEEWPVAGLAAAVPGFIADELIHLRNHEAAKRLKRLTEIGRALGRA